MTAKQFLKRALHPWRTALGRFSLSPLEARVAALEGAVYDLRQSQTLFHKAAALIAADKIEGDYLEFGVYRGGSFVSAYHSLAAVFATMTTPGVWNTEPDCVARRAQWSRMRFFAFDSFEGLPRPQGLDALSRDFTDGKFACSESDFRRYAASQGVPPDKLVTVPGWFKDTLNRATTERHALSRAAIVHVDCDLYDSTRTVLDFVTDLLVEGSVLIFDDWYNFGGDPDLGEQRAFREWRWAHPDFVVSEYQKEGPWRNSFLVHRLGRQGPASL
jgi:O-methyltransferase